MVTPLPGYDAFAAGDKPSADAWNGIHLQTNMYFATAAARDTALSAELQEGLTAWVSDVGDYALTRYEGGAWRVVEVWGSGSPEGAVTAGIGAVYHRKDGGAGTTIYHKESGAGNTGWTAVDVASATTAIQLYPENLTAVGGTAPTRQGLVSSATFWVGWLMDATADEIVAGQILVPSGWSTVDIDLVWCNIAATSGNVRWDALTQVKGDGDTLANGWATSPANYAALGQYVVETSTLRTGVAVTAGKYLGVLIQRVGSNAGDTLANDAAVLAVNIRKAS